MLENRKLINYSKYKLVFENEMYLKCVKSYRYRVTISRLRLSAHDLEVELGRHN